MSAPANSPPPVLASYPRLGTFVVQHRRSRAIRKIASLCNRYLAWFGNDNYDLWANGETFVVERLARFQPRVLLDVGANVGDWSAAAAAYCSSAEIHAFEISTPTYDVLAANTRHLPKVHAENVGMSDSEGTIRIRHFAALPALTTSTDYPHALPFTELEARVITGDSYAESQGLTHIDMLKIDVEGMEERVLNGFSKMFAQRAIDLVQFEYGRVNIINHFLLRDAYAFFRERGYVVGKIFPNYVDFRDYQLTDEDFMGPNYLACREELADYLKAFRGHVNGNV